MPMRMANKQSGVLGAWLNRKCLVKKTQVRNTGLKSRCLVEPQVLGAWLKRIKKQVEKKGCLVLGRKKQVETQVLGAWCLVELQVLSD
jgi:hypothetical protein